MCFGLKSVPAIFNSVSSFITRFVKIMGFPVVGYLDDYFVAGPNYEICLERQRWLVGFLEYLGFSVNYSKVTPPSQVPKFLGIIVDRNRMVFRLLEEKITKALEGIKDMLGSDWTSFKKLVKLTGFWRIALPWQKGAAHFLGDVILS